MAELHHECGIVAVYHYGQGQDCQLVNGYVWRRRFEDDSQDAARYPESGAAGCRDHDL